MPTYPPDLRTACRPAPRSGLGSAVLAALCLAVCAAQAQVYLQPGVTADPSGGLGASASDAPATVDRFDGIVVSSTDGRPVPRVLVTSMDRRMAAMTDSQGRFSFELRRSAAQGTTHVFSSYPPDPPQATTGTPVQLTVRKPGYITNTVVALLSAPGTAPAQVQLKIVPAAVLTGRVYADSGDMPQGYSVMLRQKRIQDGSASWMNMQSAAVDRDGQFRFANLQPGDYKVVAPAWVPFSNPRKSQAESVSGFLATYYPGMDTLAAATPLHIGAGETATANLTLRTASFYHVNLAVAGSQEPNAGLQVTLQPEMPGINLNNVQGSVSGYLPDGDYDVLLYSYGPAKMGMSQSNAAVHLHVSGRGVQGEPVAMHPAPEVPVIVRRELTNPQPQVVQQGPPLWVNFQSTETGNGMGMVPQMSPIQPGQDESALEVQNVTPGVYRVVVVSGSLSYPAAVSSGTTDLLREPLRVVPGEVPRPIEVTLRDDFGSISGTVLTGSAAQPPGDSWVPEFTIVAIPLDKPEANADQMIADYAHRFTMPHVAPGRYLLMASHQASPRTLEFRNEDVLRGLLSQGTVVTVSSGQKVEVQLPLMPEAAE